MARFPITQCGFFDYDLGRQPEAQFRAIHKANVNVQSVLFKRRIDVMDDLPFEAGESLASVWL